ncbi:hypothetical protein A1Q1_03893 [Trichosporon asahii var. asahii CBS 2479]|uniref:Uncharacterized protein n=1 Tax=Trichosporon asahii var. asahii (strain ATCC 90039 / CBS 2479 / JCM 2466 / KCTC 7840 / NBRC 103889/ NCYC 2677 / UAMH 7654) TaxID=1186058 RepID=J6ERW5_TRIAS|nr:hypothetical protein A1Q1_03893 [Trichosporon asahii var. asahii CBS 2479]EJT47264.1 hypothetical protein A1Q1_03893 [Trichosporon asahii var. asahii CBS 2479]
MSDAMLPSHNGDLSANSSGHINNEKGRAADNQTTAPGDLVVKNLQLVGRDGVLPSPATGLAPGGPGRTFFSSNLPSAAARSAAYCLAAAASVRVWAGTVRDSSRPHYLEPGANGPAPAASGLDAIACLGEFVGTTLFLFFSLGGTSVALQAANSVTGNVKDGASTFNTSNLGGVTLAPSSGAHCGVPK